MVATNFIDCNVIEFQLVVDTTEGATRFIACTMFMLPLVVAIRLVGGISHFIANSMVVLKMVVATIMVLLGLW